MRSERSRPTNATAVRVTPQQVASFRLSRHHLSKRAPRSALASVFGDIAGAQAQVLSAGALSVRPRVNGATCHEVESAIWTERTLVRAWCMRRTLFLLPSDQLAVFARGTSRRPAYNLRWAIPRVGSERRLEELIDTLGGILDRPRSRNEIARLLASEGYRLRSRAGGGWGSERSVPWVKVGKASLPVGFLLHLLGTRYVICSGPNEGNESTYVRADRWVPRWRDVAAEQAEEELLVRYLRAFGPSTVSDFALWMGLYVRDAKQIWRRLVGKLAQVEVSGQTAWALRSDLSELEEVSASSPLVKLLPLFDTFLLGHRSHRNVVDEKDHKKVYRSQGWVSAALTVDGRARGTWSHTRGKGTLAVRVCPFSRLPSAILPKVKEEADDLGRFLGYDDVKTVID